MKFSFRIMAMPTLLMAPLLSGCVAAVAAGAVVTASSVNDRRGFNTVMSDKNIQLSAYDLLNADKELVLQNRVMISVYDGMMLLTGEVRTEALKQRAESIVTGFNGINRLVNEIDIMEPQGYWENRNDNKITAAVKLAMADATSLPGFDVTKIKISTAHRVVYLMAILTPQEEEVVVEIARNVPDVERVVKIFKLYEEPKSESAPEKTSSP